MNLESDGDSINSSAAEMMCTSSEEECCDKYIKE